MASHHVRHQRRLAPTLLLAIVAGCVSAPPPVRQAQAPVTLRSAMLRVHATARAAVGLPPLVWSDALAADAQGWASTLAASGRFDHARQDAEGENLWMGTRGAFGYAAMAGYWVGERRWFTGPATPLSSRTGRWQDVGHYSQIVWRGTTRIGCAIASNARDDILVCRYWPAGNIEGEAAY